MRSAVVFGDENSREVDGFERVGGNEHEEPTEQLLPGLDAPLMRKEDVEGRREETKKEDVKRHRRGARRRETKILLFA